MATSEPTGDSCQSSWHDDEQLLQRHLVELAVVLVLALPGVVANGVSIYVWHRARRPLPVLSRLLVYLLALDVLLLLSSCASAVVAGAGERVDWPFLVLGSSLVSLITYTVLTTALARFFHHGLVSGGHSVRSCRTLATLCLLALVVVLMLNVTEIFFVDYDILTGRRFIFDLIDTVVCFLYPLTCALLTILALVFFLRQNKVKDPVGLRSRSPLRSKLKVVAYERAKSRSRSRQGRGLSFDRSMTSPSYHHSPMTSSAHWRNAGNARPDAESATELSPGPYALSPQPSHMEPRATREGSDHVVSAMPHASSPQPSLDSQSRDQADPGEPLTFRTLSPSDRAFLAATPPTRPPRSLPPCGGRGAEAALSMARETLPPAASPGGTLRQPRPSARSSSRMQAADVTSETTRCCDTCQTPAPARRPPPEVGSTCRGRSPPVSDSDPDRSGACRASPASTSSTRCCQKRRAARAQGRQATGDSRREGDNSGLRRLFTPPTLNVPDNAYREDELGAAWSSHRGGGSALQTQPRVTVLTPRAPLHRLQRVDAKEEEGWEEGDTGVERVRVVPPTPAPTLATSAPSMKQIVLHVSDNEAVVRGSMSREAYGVTLMVVVLGGLCWLAFPSYLVLVYQASYRPFVDDGEQWVLRLVSLGVSAANSSVKFIVFRLLCGSFTKLYRRNCCFGQRTRRDAYEGKREAVEERTEAQREKIDDRKLAERGRVEDQTEREKR